MICRIPSSKASCFALGAAAGLWMIAVLPLLSADAPNEHVLFSFKKSGPQIDGVVTGDSAWENTQVAEGFLVLGGGKAATNATSVRTTWDEEAIFFGMTVETPPEYKVAADRADPSENDCVEIWLSSGPDSNLWYQLIVDASGREAAYLHSGESTTLSDLDFDVRTSKTKTGWEIEAAIPFRSLGLPPPENGAFCRFAVNRVDRSASPPELSSWARLSQFAQKSHFPQLIFSSDWEVSPEMAYWRQNREHERLLRRPRVSARDLLAADSKDAQTYTLWKYDPASITEERRKKHAGLQTYGLFGDAIYWSGYNDLADAAPAFCEAAVGIDKAMVELSKLEDLLLQTERAGFYATRLSPSAEQNDQLKMVSQPSALMDELDALYQIYGKAFDEGWDAKSLEGMPARLAQLQKRVAEMRENTSSLLAGWQTDARSLAPWKPANLRLPAGARPTDASGTPNRIHHTLYGSFPFQKSIALLGNQWDAVNIDWTRTIPESDGQGNYQFPLLKKYVDFIQKNSPGMKVSYHMLFGSYYAMPFPDWLEKKTVEDPDLLLTSSDGHQAIKRLAGPGSVPINDGMNINNPLIQDYVRESVGALAKQFGQETAYVVANWEDNAILHLPQVASAKGYRTVGYNPTGRKAFHDYLTARYGTIAELNRKWDANYASFAAIEPPEDKWLKPAGAASGLTYEWERFIRMNHLSYSRLMNDSYKKAAPDTPIMIDQSHFLADGNLYWVFKENIADIYSFHWTPSNEDAIWTFLSRLTTRFGKTMGYFENYSSMYTNRVMGDEIKARAALREFFWRLYTRGNRYQAWWLTGFTGPTEYAVAYGGGLFGLDFDQTILRWSMSLLPVMWERGRAIEKALVETRPEPTRAAILQSDATVLNLSARAMRVASGLPPVTNTILLHNEFLAPGGYPVDFVTEEMILDGKAALSEFSTLILSNGYWMDPAFSVLLKQWVEEGGNLIAIGPFAMETPWGTEIEPGQSAFLTAFAPVKRTGKDLWSAKFERTGDNSAIQSRTLKKGTVHYLSRSVDAFVKSAEARKELENLLAQEIPRRAVSDAAAIKITTRVAEDGVTYVFPVNTSLTDPVSATITVQGQWSSALDCVIPGDFPIALTPGEKSVSFQTRLAPGDWTAIQLSSATGESQP